MGGHNRPRSGPTRNRDATPGRDGGTYGGGDAWLAGPAQQAKPVDGIQLGMGTLERGDDFARLDEIAEAAGMEFAQAVHTLADRFGEPPFSVLNACKGEWQSRKRTWISLGIKSELGRDEHTDGQEPNGDGRGKAKTYNTAQSIVDNPSYNRKAADRASNLTGAPPRPDSPVGTGTENMSTGTSIFDPVLCELIYHWFCPRGGHILDPFAGGSVRGIVASCLGYKYTGIDLRPEQVEANEAQWAEIIDKLAPPSSLNHAELLAQHPRPIWIEGDARNALMLGGPDGGYDFLFTCPPYFNLEVYSDDPADLSNCPNYGEFLNAYWQIVTDCVSVLNDNRFACFVVGDLRDERGFYRNLPGDTVMAFESAGAKLYNEAILVTSRGSLAIRVAGQFRYGRKLGKTHQNLLVFYKGDPAKIRDLGEVDVGVARADIEDPTHYRDEVPA